MASGAGRAGIAVIRISGPRAHAALSALTRRSLPDDRVAIVRKLYATDQDLIDESLVLKFSAPRSFTGEDLVELHVHGGPAVIDGVSEALFTLGLDQAGPGEFTRRAFANGRLDLTQAEGLADLIDAVSVGQKRQALRQMDGGLRIRYENWRDQILDLLAAIEGELDFADEADVPTRLAATAAPGLASLASELQRVLEDSPRGERIRHGLDVTFIGAPNAGKSSIINSLGGREAAIVSPEAGTTRDIVEVNLEIGGLPVRLSDTAGLRDTENQIEREGVKRALARAQASDLKIAVVDAAKPEQFDTLLPHIGKDDVIVFNKIDLLQPGETETLINVSRETWQRLNPDADDNSVLAVSATNGAGLTALETELMARIGRLFSVGEVAGLTRVRHRDCVKRALDAVQRAEDRLPIAPEVAGAELVGALNALKELSGETDIEAVLDRVFSRFCIGK